MRVRQPVVLEHFAQPGLQQLAGRGVRQLGDERDVVGKPPSRDLVLQEREQLIARQLLPRLLHDDEQRALLPLRVGDADHRRLGDGGMPHRRVLQRDR